MMDKKSKKHSPKQLDEKQVSNVSGGHDVTITDDGVTITGNNPGIDDVNMSFGDDTLMVSSITIVEEKHTTKN